VAYKRKPKVFRVSFEDPHPLAGLTVVTKGLSVREFAAFGLRLGDVAQIEQAGSDAEKLAELNDLLEAIDEVREMFADALISWDVLNEDGSEVPATLEGVQSLDDSEFFGIVNEWLAAIGGPDPELGKGSGLGGTIPALSDLMEPLSPSPAS
jgi:hypothetical protein